VNAEKLPHPGRFCPEKSDHMMQNRVMARIALVGERNESVVAHRAIPLALGLSAAASGVTLEPIWLRTDGISGPADLEPYDGIWVVPASPYAAMNGALAAIRAAREGGKPFLGTCGGFQHALIEIARSLPGRAGADHAETAPDAPDQVIVPLTCSLAGGAGETIRLLPGSRLEANFGAGSSRETYNCRYGLDERQRGPLESAGVIFSAIGEDGAARGFELAGHPFFVATLFQPERAALEGRAHPLVTAFVAAAAGFSAAAAGGRKPSGTDGEAA